MIINSCNSLENIVSASAEENVIDKEIYHEVFQEYQDATIQYHQIGEEGLARDYMLIKEYLIINDEGFEPWYGFYDIDGNGQDELFIGYKEKENEEWQIMDIFAYTENGNRRLGDYGTFAETGESYIFKDGTICFVSQYAYVFCRIEEDGYTLGLIDTYACNEKVIDGQEEDVKTYSNEEETLTQDELNEKMNTLGGTIEIDWKKMELQNDISQNEGENTESISFTGIEPYDEILNGYYEGIIAGWDLQTFKDHGLCYLTGYDPDLDQTGYCLLDIDQNGMEELIVGRNNDEDYEGMVFEIYTISDDESLCIASSGERDRYYICKDNTIANEGSSSALNSSWRFYDLIDGQLQLRESVFLDGYYDSENPWFYTTEEKGGDYTTPISEEDAHAIIDKYEHADISFIPLSSIHEDQ